MQVTTAATAPIVWAQACQVCVYVSAPHPGDLNNFLMLLDDFFNYREKVMAREQPCTWILTACANAEHTLDASLPHHRNLPRFEVDRPAPSPFTPAPDQRAPWHVHHWASHPSPKESSPQELHPHISVDIASVWDDR